jgi:threonine synthase
MSSTLYKSTRGGEQHVPFEDVVMKGLAEDGGLFIPHHIPTIEPCKFPLFDTQSLDNRQWFQDVAFVVIRPYISKTEVSDEQLAAILHQSFGSEHVFRHANVTPLCSLQQPSTASVSAASATATSELHIVELFHGPTFAFKDVAMQFLGHLFSFFLQQHRHQHQSNGDAEQQACRDYTWINVLGATSGDTGSAAVHGLADKPGVRVFMLHPHKRVSPLQEKQMTTVLADNIHNIALLDSSFDTCQTLVKELFEDLEFRKKHHLAAVVCYKGAHTRTPALVHTTHTFGHFADCMHYRGRTRSIGLAFLCKYDKHRICATNDW